MKNKRQSSPVVAIALAAVVLACCFAGLVAGCSRARAPRKPAAVRAPAEYKPLFPAGTTISAFRNLYAEGTNAVVRAFNAAVTGKAARVASLCAAESGGTNAAVSGSLRLQTDGDAVMRSYFPCLSGLGPGDFKWAAVSVGRIDVPDAASGAAPFQAPDVAVVLHTSKPIDPAGLVDGLRKLLRNEKEAFCAAASDHDGMIRARIDELPAIGSFEKAPRNGLPAMRFVFADPALTNGVSRLSPVIAQVLDGRLLVLASCDEALDVIEALYAGKGEAKAPDPVIAAAVNGDNSSLGAFSFPGLDGLVAKLLPPEQPVPADMAEPMAFVKGLEAAGIACGTDGDNFFVEYSLDFKDQALAYALSSKALAGKAAVGMVVAIAQQAPSLQAFAMKLLDNIVATASGGKFRLRFSLSAAMIDAVDAGELAALCKENGDDECGECDECDGECDDDADDAAGGE